MRPPQSWRTARVTAGIAIVTALAWLVAEALGLQVAAAIRGGFIPVRMGMGGDFSVVPAWLTPLSATLVHSGLMHLAFNLLILVYCGRSVEGVLGPVSLAVLYVVGAYAAASGQYLQDPREIMPMVGASGAIAAVIGAYAMLFGRNRVKVENATLALWLNALWLAAAWIGLQLLVGYATTGGAVTIAIWAHIGGFLVGIALARPLLIFRYRKA
jgi:membrane associated rhomboid family serine protease